MKKPLLLLFGAGATRGAFEERSVPPPLDRDFFDIAAQVKGRGTPHLAKKVMRDVFSLNRRVNGVALEEYFRDIETRAHILTFAKPRNKPKDWERRARELQELIRRVVLQTTCKFSQAPAVAEVSAGHAALLEYVRSGDTLLTFNYDTVIEEAFAATAELWNPADGYGLEATGTDGAWAKRWYRGHQQAEGRISKVQLLKLHGSVNWIVKGGRIHLKDRPYVVRANKHDKCAILAPGWNKPIDKPPFSALWRQARLKLESAHTLAIIGYSLPETDLLAQAIFAEVSRRRAAAGKWLKHFYVANPNREVRKRLIDLFVPALGPIGRVYETAGVDELQRLWKAEGPGR